MTGVSQMFRWNANLVRGLAQSVLERAKVIRSTLTPYTSEGAMTVQTKAGGKTQGKKLTVKKTPKKTAKKVTKAPVRKSKRTNA